MTFTLCSFVVSAQKCLCEMFSVASPVVEDGKLTLEVFGGVFSIILFEWSIFERMSCRTLLLFSVVLLETFLVSHCLL